MTGGAQQLVFAGAVASAPGGGGQRLPENRLPGGQQPDQQWREIRLGARAFHQHRPGLAEAGAGLDEVDNARKHNRNLDRIRRERLETATLKLRNALVDVQYILDRILSEKAAKAVFEGRSQLSRLKTPVIERVSARLLSLFDDSKTGLEEFSDSGYRATAEASRLRLQRALKEFLEVLAERQPERSALVLAQGFRSEDYFRPDQRALQCHYQEICRCGRAHFQRTCSDCS